MSQTPDLITISAAPVGPCAGSVGAFRKTRCILSVLQCGPAQVTAAILCTIALAACSTSTSTATQVRQWASRQCAHARADHRAWAIGFLHSMQNASTETAIDNLAAPLDAVPIVASFHGKRYHFTCR